MAETKDSLPPTKPEQSDDPLCEQCQANTSRYKCPGCGFRFCSVACSKIHKAESGCTGKKTPFEYHDITAFPDQSVRTDYTFLESVSRAADAAKRTLRDYGSVKREIRGQGRGRFPGKGKHEKKFVLNIPWEARLLLKEARKRNIGIKFMPKGMSRREANSSKFQKHEGKLQFKVELWFMNEDPPLQLYKENVFENSTLYEILGDFLSIRQGNVSLRHKLGHSSSAFRPLPDAVSREMETLRDEAWQQLMKKVSEATMASKYNHGSRVEHSAKRMKTDADASPTNLRGQAASLNDPSAIPLDDEEYQPNYDKESDHKNRKDNKAHTDGLSDRCSTENSSAGVDHVAKPCDDADMESSSEYDQMCPSCEESPSFGLKVYMEKPNCPATDRRFWQLHPMLPLSVALRGTNFVEFPKLYVVVEGSEQDENFREGEPEVPSVLSELEQRQIERYKVKREQQACRASGEALEKAGDEGSKDKPSARDGTSNGYRLNAHGPAVPASYQAIPSAPMTVPMPTFGMAPMMQQWQSGGVSPYEMPAMWQQQHQQPPQPPMYPSMPFVPVPYPVFMNGQQLRPSHPQQQQQQQQHHMYAGNPHWKPC